MDKNGQHAIETKDCDEYLLPHEGVLEVIRGTLVKADGSTYDPTDFVTLTNNGWNLFQSLQYQWSWLT